MSFIDFQGEADSSYYQKEALFSSTPSRENVTIFVENEDDVPFWYRMFTSYLPHMTFDFVPGGRGNLDRGKSVVLERWQIGALNRNKLLCVDSDYDGVLWEKSDWVRKYEKDIPDEQLPYVFQTHAYAYENYVCSPKILEDYAVLLSLSAANPSGFDTTRFLRDYSSIIYPLFLLSVYYEKVGRPHQFTRDNLQEAIAIPQKDIEIHDNNGKKYLATLRRTVKDKLRRSFQSQCATRRDCKMLKQELKALAKQLEVREITSENCYLFIRGHDMLKSMAQLLKHITRSRRDKLRGVRGGLAGQARQKPFTCTLDVTSEPFRHLQNSGASEKTIERHISKLNGKKFYSEEDFRRNIATLKVEPPVDDAVLRSYKEALVAHAVTTPQSLSPKQKQGLSDAQAKYNNRIFGEEESLLKKKQSTDFWEQMLWENALRRNRGLNDEHNAPYKRLQDDIRQYAEGFNDLIKT